MDKEESPAKAESVKKTARFSVEKIIRYTLVGLIALSLGYLHYLYVSTLFENNLNFSHLSTMEREISLRTEMGFYYSYYKTVVEERPFIAGVSKLMYDRLVEFPKEVNAFNRFNIAPEVLIGAMYRYLEPWLNTSTYRQCHMVYRGDEVEPVQSCVGLGEPMLFYLEAVWWLAGLLVAALFLSAYSLSNSVLGGLLAVAQYFANHVECTRVQWTPNERENMAAPLLLLQMGLVATQLRNGRTYCRLQVSIFIVNCLCLLFWQFSQFVFLTQTVIFFLMEQLKIIDLKALCIFLHSHFCGLHMAVLLLQGNDMLKTSLYTSFFLVVSTYCLFFSSFRIKVQNRLDLFVEAWLVILRLLIVITSSFYLKHLISDFLEIEDDTHVWDILYSKFTSYKNFHTLLYTCSEVFDFLPLSTVVNMTKTCLIPMVVFGVCVRVYSWFGEEKKTEKKEVLEDEDSGIENNADSKEKNDVEMDMTDSTVRYLRRLKIEPDVVYQVAQLCVFAILAALVMRLKLLLGMQLCVVSALAVNANHKIEPAVVYQVAQLCEFAILAALVMRLKLLLGMQLCVVSALAVNATIVYQVAQLCEFAILAALVMRLKLLLGMQLCVVSALAVNANHKISPLMPNQLASDAAIELSLSSSSSYVGADTTTATSSAYMKVSPPVTASGRSFRSIENRIFETDEPCATPILVVAASDRTVPPSETTTCVLFRRRRERFQPDAGVGGRARGTQRGERARQSSHSHARYALMLTSQLSLVTYLSAGLVFSSGLDRQSSIEPAVVYQVAQLCVFAILAALVMRLKLLLGMQLCVVSALAVNANHKIEPAVVYQVAQLCVFAILAALVMRLKLLLGMQLCVVSALAVNANHKVPPSLRKYLPLCWVAGCAALAHRLSVNMSAEMSHISEFSDFQQEELLNWILKETGAKAAFAGSMPILATVMLVTRRPIVAHPHYENKEVQYNTIGNKETGAKAAFAGSMPILATVMLVTRRPIVAHPHYENKEARYNTIQYNTIQYNIVGNKETGAKAAFAGSMPILATVMLVTRRPIVAHPHYENKEARARAYAVYKTYGKFTTDELYKELTALKAIYLIVEHKYCYGRSRQGCSFEDIWESEYPSRRGPRACHALLAGTQDHFYPVFRNNHYAVFRLHDYSVRYMPRSFDT
ncbi:protein C-mannosyl-transferase DPY19L1 [Cydia fagiglandana]|uniref:protein C-mannosyl-transferase DPY19L1 n=1 Tax=Cydia fagiglandana TaxID=1458189 RepID=UPI002FEE601C